MHRLVALILVVNSAYQATSAAGRAQYQHPASLQTNHKVLSSAYSPTLNTSPDGSKAFFAFTEVNTPYYYYQYYAPVFKNDLGQPPQFQHTSFEAPFRNEANPYNFRGTTVVPKLFYPAPPNVPLGRPETPLVNDCTSPPYCDLRVNFSPPLQIPDQKVPSAIPSPVIINQPYAPSFTNYGASPRRIFPPPPPMKPIPPSDLATDSPNIIRKNSKEDPLADLFGKGRTFGSTNTPVPFSATADPPNEYSRPLFVPGSLATPSSSVIKDEVRRGVLFQPDGSQINLFSNSSPSSTYVPPPSASSVESKEHSESSSDVGNKGTPAEADIIASPINSNLALTSSSSTVRSIVLSTDIEVKDHDSLDSDRSFFGQNPPLSQLQSNISSTLKLHTQKIPQKVHSIKMTKKGFYKKPKVLFEAPGHYEPN